MACCICGGRMAPFEYYVLKDEVWLAAHPVKGDGKHAHLTCVEATIGRPLSFDDLTDHPANKVVLFFAGRR